jgi:hypothetical protein
MLSFMRRLFRPLLILLALFFVFEAWLWTRLEPVVAWIVALIPLERLKARVAAAIESLSPAATLVVFVVPFIVLFPLKILEVWLLAQHNWLGALATLVVAKLVGLGVTAFIFEVTRPKLMQMAWFCRFYGWVIWLLDQAHALVDPIKGRVRIWLRMISPGRAGRMLKLFLRIRRRMQAARGAA